MSTKSWLGMLGVVLGFLLSGPIAAEEVTIFEICTDSHGKTLPAVADYEQTMLVRTVTEQGRPAIRYNPEVLPRLISATRLFFYAHQCARHGLADSGKLVSAELARLADCIGLNALLTGEMLKCSDLPTLQTELSFTDAEWEFLPGPQRTFDLSNCRATASVLRLPLVSYPSKQQIAWNKCIHACADRLWHCQKPCGGIACGCCGEAYGQCKAMA